MALGKSNDDLSRNPIKKITVDEDVEHPNKIVDGLREIQLLKDVLVE